MDGGITWGQPRVGTSSALFSDGTVVAMSTPVRLCPTEPRAVQVAHDASHAQTFRQNQERQNMEHQSRERVHHVGCGTDVTQSQRTGTVPQGTAFILALGRSTHS